jgi:hypothetical protein
MKTDFIEQPKPDILEPGESLAYNEFCNHIDHCKLCRLVANRRWVCCMIGKALLKRWEAFKNATGAKQNV